MKKVIEERERNERRNDIVIRGLKKENMCMKKVAEEFLEQQFGVEEKIKKSYVVGKGEKVVVVVT